MSTSNYEMMVCELANQIENDGVEFDTQFDELVGFGCVETTDYEVEREYVRTALVADEHGFPVPVMVVETDDGCAVDQPYWTHSGDRPVIYDEAIISDIERSAAGFMPEEVADLTGAPFTSTSRYGSGKHQERNFHSVVRFVFAHVGEQELLRKGWRRFWVRVYEQQNYSFLFPKQVRAIRSLFGRFGVCAAVK